MKAKEKAHIHFTEGKPAAYREKAPTVKECKGLLDFMDWHCKWQDTIIAYMKEPEFKDKDIVFDIKTGQKCRIDKEGMTDDKVWVLNMTGSIGGIMLNKEQLNELYSHYHEGQVIDLKDYRYVEEVLVNYCKECEEAYVDFKCPKCDDGTYYIDRLMCQEVIEPEELEVAFEAGGVNLQTNATINPEWQQFHDSCHEGKTLLDKR